MLPAGSTKSFCTRAENTANNLHLLPGLGHGILSGQPDQATRILHLVHDLVTRIDTQSTTNTFVLQTVTDINAGRANLDTDAAIDAIAGMAALLAGASRFAALAVVRHASGGGVEHHALET